MQPRYFFLGLIRVGMWEYLWGMTGAQIELMAIDKPLTLYGKENEFSVPDEDELERCRMQYEAEHAEDGGIIDPKKLMSNFK
jgi:hypothetical protein